MENKKSKKKKKDLTTYSATLHLEGYSIMLECENGCLSLSHVLNSKVLLYTKLNVNFNTTKVTKSFEPQKYLKGSLLFSTHSQIDNGTSNGLGVGKRKPCDFSEYELLSTSSIFGLCKLNNSVF